MIDRSNRTLAALSSVAALSLLAPATAPAQAPDRRDCVVRPEPGGLDDLHFESFAHELGSLQRHFGSLQRHFGSTQRHFGKIERKFGRAPASPGGHRGG